MKIEHKIIKDVSDNITTKIKEARKVLDILEMKTSFLRERLNKKNIEIMSFNPEFCNDLRHVIWESAYHLKKIGEDLSFDHNFLLSHLKKEGVS